MKRVVYNGADLPVADRLAPSSYATGHTLRIVLSRQTAVLQAQIQADPNRLAQAPLSVVLVRDDLDAARRFTGIISIRAEADGRATKRGLAPGKYRAFVLPTDEVSSLQRPGVMDGYLSTATFLNLEPGQSGALSLDYR